MARSPQEWSRSPDGKLWVPEPTRRSVVTAGAAALLFGCGQTQKGPGGSLGGEGGSDMTGGSGGGTGGSGSGGKGGAGSGGSLGTGGSGTGGMADASAGGMDAGGSGGADGAYGPDGGGLAGPDGAMAGPDGATQLACTQRSEQIVGPFPASGVQLNRSDVRSDPGDNNTVKPGVPMRVVIKVGTRNGGNCVPMKGAVVNIWQCDAVGLYSGYASEGTGKNQFLRGYQVTDGSGVVEFLTIYPGSYSGRCVHNHFSVRMSPSVSFPSGGFVGQMYFPDDVTDQVLTQAPYKASGRTRNGQDSFYKKDMLATVTRVGNTWVAELELAV